MAMRVWDYFAVGQSNKQGAACKWPGPRNAAQRDRAVSLRTGQTDPYPGSNNTGQGGSMFPFLQDMLYARGIYLRVWNYAIGGASIYQYTGRLGATISTPTVPAANGYFSGGEMSGGTTVCVEGDADFDPFGLLARTRAAIQSVAGTSERIITSWSNGESDQAGVSRTQYGQAQGSIADYLRASIAFEQQAAHTHLIGLSLQLDTTSSGDMVLMQQAIADALGTRTWTKPGADLFAEWGPNAPRYKDSDTAGYVHLTLNPGQRRHAELEFAAMQGAGLL